MNSEVAFDKWPFLQWWAIDEVQDAVLGSRLRLILLLWVLFRWWEFGGLVLVRLEMKCCDGDGGGGSC